MGFETFRNYVELQNTDLAMSVTTVRIVRNYGTNSQLLAALSQSEEISSDFCCFYGGGIRYNEDIMHSFQNFIVRLIPNHPPPLETRIWKLVVRALVTSSGKADGQPTVVNG